MNEDGSPGLDPPGPCDLERLEAETLGDRELLVRLVRTFAEDCPGHLRRLARAIRDGKPRELARAAHAFLGVLSILRAPRAAELARQLEALGEKEDLGGSAQTLAALEEETSRLLAFLAEVIAERPRS